MALEFHWGTILCVADGAGGRSGGAEAASLAIQQVKEGAQDCQTAEACAELLRKMDASIAKDTAAGETTCVLAVFTADEIFGASVGDSGAWLVSAKGPPLHLTRGQQRKPFLGSGAAWAVPFQVERRSGTLLLATDGLLKYTSTERIVETIRSGAPETAGEKLVGLVRYASGALPDDVTIILANV